MRRGYIRIDRVGASPAEQQRALESAGINDFGDEGPIYIDPLRKKRLKEGEDPLPERTLAIKSLRAGDELVVSNAARLGLNRADILKCLAEIGAKRAAVYVVDEDRVFACSPEIADAVAFAEIADKKLLAERMQKARKGRKEFGSATGRKSKLPKDGPALAQIQALWTDPTVHADEVVKASGVSLATLHRKLGGRTTPIFGRMVRRKRPE